MLTLIAGSSVFGRLLVGFSFDRLGGKASYLICLSALSASLLFLVLVENVRWLYPFAVIYGFAHGGLFTVVSPTVAERFGLLEHGKIFGLIVFFGTIGGSAMPIITGRVFDLYNSYTAAFMALFIMAFMGVVLVMVMPSHDPKKEYG